MMTCYSLGALGVVARPLQVADGFGGLVGDPDEGEISRAEVMGQLGGVAAIGLDPAAGLDRDHRRGDDMTEVSGGLEIPVETVPGRAGFVATDDRLRRSQATDGLEERGEV